MHTGDSGVQGPGYGRDPVAYRRSFSVRCRSVTHEKRQGDEPPGGPQHDHRLPDAMDVPVSSDPFELDPVIHTDADGNRIHWDDG